MNDEQTTQVDDDEDDCLDCGCGGRGPSPFSRILHFMIGCVMATLALGFILTALNPTADGD